MKKRHISAALSIAFAITIAACGESSKEDQAIGEIRIFDFSAPSNSATSTATATATAPASTMQCPADKPFYNAFGDACFGDSSQFCQFNLNCTDPSAPFCYHGICSDVDPMKEDPCKDPNASASLVGVCFDPWFDSGSCGGYTHVCGGGTQCQQGFCVDNSVTCPDEAPHSYQGKCYNFFSDNNNCSGVGQVCPAFKPTCYLARCYDAIPGKLAADLINWPELEHSSLRPNLTKPTSKN